MDFNAVGCGQTLGDSIVLWLQATGRSRRGRHASQFLLEAPVMIDSPAWGHLKTLNPRVLGSAKPQNQGFALCQAANQYPTHENSGMCPGERRRSDQLLPYSVESAPCAALNCCAPSIHEKRAA
jgi:hypothetical protein